MGEKAGAADDESESDEEIDQLKSWILLLESEASISGQEKKAIKKFEEAKDAIKANVKKDGWTTAIRRTHGELVQQIKDEIQELKRQRQEQKDLQKAMKQSLQ